MAKLFYETLGVQDNATHEEIKRAYRLKAKALHPDVTKTRDTTREFQELQEVYSVLGSPERRKLYDEGNEEAARSPDTKATEADFDPFPCTSCEQISAQPRFISFYWVTSFIIFTYRRECSGIYCPSCAAKKLFWSSLITGAVGWIAFPWGIIWSIKALFYNIIGGSQTAEINALVLTKQALYFHNSGMPDVAAATAADALPYAQRSSKTPTGAACLKALGFFAGRKVVMNSKWKGLSKPRLAALIGFAIPICAWYFFITANSAASLTRELDRSAVTLNRQCPRMIDQITRMDSVISGPGPQFTYNYTVTTLTSSDLDGSKFQEALHTSLVTNFRKEKEMTRLAEKGVVFHYNWFGKDGIIISRLTLTKEDLIEHSVKLPTKTSPSTNVIAAPAAVNVTHVEKQTHMSSEQPERNIPALPSKTTQKPASSSSANMEVKSFNMLKVDAEKGDAKAQFKLGLIYSWGFEGVTKDEVEAVQWYTKAAEQGFAKAQAYLGSMYRRGEGVTKDEVEAVKWFRKAAVQGNIDAQIKLGVMFAEGEGVNKDEVEAVQWYTKAAQQGFAFAQESLAIMYADGEGVPKDFVESYKWLLLSSAQGRESAKKLVATLEVTMTREQIAEGQKLAREFKPLYNLEAN